MGRSVFSRTLRTMGSHQCDPQHLLVMRLGAVWGEGGIWGTKHRRCKDLGPTPGPCPPTGGPRFPRCQYTQHFALVILLLASYGRSFAQEGPRIRTSNIYEGFSISSALSSIEKQSLGSPLMNSMRTLDK